MGPKKKVKGEQEKALSIDDPINTADWKCMVAMGVEKTAADGFVLREFMDEAFNGRRREVKFINYDLFVLSILNDFAEGELSFRYTFLLQFAKIFQDAAEYVRNKTPIPARLLVKVVKALLFYLRDESLQKLMVSEPADPVKAMADRPADMVAATPKATQRKKELRSIRDSDVKIRPLSLTKEDTKLVKRNEGGKETPSIDDAPLGGFFNLYVLLTGFYNPELPLELIEAKVPLHLVLCIDTALSNVKRITSSGYRRSQKRGVASNSVEIEGFWNGFLRMVWDPRVSFHFKDVIFQVYSPQKLLCEKKQLKEFVYREISYLMYDLSDYKRQLLDYLNSMKIWKVNETEKISAKSKDKFQLETDDMPGECLRVPLVLQCILDVICGEDGKDVVEQKISFIDSIDSSKSSKKSSERIPTQSVLAENGSPIATPNWSQIIYESGDYNASRLYSKIKELDVAYELIGKRHVDSFPPKSMTRKKSSRVSCIVKNRMRAENMEEALNAENGVFGSYWKQCRGNQSKSMQNSKSFSVPVDYFLYVLLMSKIVCSRQTRKKTNEIPIAALTHSSSSSSNSSNGGESRNSVSAKKKSTFELIENLCEEMRKPHFTVTDCSRNVLRCIPYNMKESSRDFFCPRELKLVTPEKVKVSSAPEFRVLPGRMDDLSFISDPVDPSELGNIEWNVFENLRTFLGTGKFPNANGFDFVEELSKAKLLSREVEYWDEYDCIDYTYSVLTDSLFVVAHNRKDEGNGHHEVFNRKLKTAVGLRDFFEYVLEDESDWFATREQLHRENLSNMFNRTSGKDSFGNFVDSDFWLEGSIKYGERIKLDDSNAGSVRRIQNESAGPSDSKKETDSKDERRRTVSNVPQSHQSRRSQSKKNPDTDSYPFEGYNIDDVAVQFSGLKTVYYADDCAMTVDLTERLYGNQDLGVHVRQGGHVLHLYSRVCPKPHILQPYTCHMILKNGIVIAFGKRFVQETALPEVSKELAEAKKSNWKPERIPPEATKNQGKVVEKREDKEFAYDMKMSLPNGLMIQVVRRIIRPCYLRQHFLGQSESGSTVIKNERCRLFLPSGIMIIMTRDGPVQILKMNTSVVNASLEKPLRKSSSAFLISERKQRPFSMEKCEIITSDGRVQTIEQSVVTSTKRIAIFQNTDIESRRVYYRRGDETNYVMSSDGTLCVQFKDGSKISSFPFMVEEEEVEGEEEGMGEEEEREGGKSENGERDDSRSEDPESGFVFVYVQVTMEHPAYATTIFNTLTNEWKLRLPFGSVITVEEDGNYFVEIDDRTEIRIREDVIEMNRYPGTGDCNPSCSLTADLTVFRRDGNSSDCDDPSRERNVYCKMTNHSTGETFVVEDNSNSYRVEGKEGSGGKAKADKDRGLPNEKGFSRERKYFNVRKDMTGFEVVHVEDLKKHLTEIGSGSVVHTEVFPGPERLRCFVLISPGVKVLDRSKKESWKVESILPDPTFRPDKVGTKKSSSTYGFPPSWMHPFPLRKRKFIPPKSLTCRIFVETVQTDFTLPRLGFLDCYFCEFPESKTDADGEHEEEEEGEGEEKGKGKGKMQKIKDFVGHLSSENQTFLRKLYLRTARKIIDEKKMGKFMDPEKLKRYTAMSEYLVEMQEYHKKSIRFHLIPNYFRYPDGICWLLLNRLVDTFLFPLTAETGNEILTEMVAASAISSASVFSNEEIEYDLEKNSINTFSDLSWRETTSAKTAPAVLTRGKFCTCQIHPVRNVTSAPVYRPKERISSYESFQWSKKLVCSFDETDLNDLKKFGGRSECSPSLTMEDLMRLRLI